MKMVIMTELTRHMDIEAAAKFIRLDGYERDDWIDLTRREQELKGVQEDIDEPIYEQAHSQGIDLLMSGGSEADWARQHCQNLLHQPPVERVGTIFTVRESDIGEGKRFVICRCNPSQVREKVLESLDQYLNAPFTYPYDPIF